MSKRVIGAEPLTMVRVGEGDAATQAYVFAGDVVPGGADPNDVQRLLDEGYLVEQEVADEPDSEDGPPAKSAAKGDWEAYARSQGASDEDLDGATKDELIEKYGA